MIKVCTKCNIEKELSEFTKDKHKLDGLSSVCRSCRKEYSRRTYVLYTKKRQDADYYLKNKDRLKNIRLKATYGITIDAYHKLFEEQKGVCAICGKPEEAIMNNRYKTKSNLSVDHNHSTGKIRGLLCQKCNRGLGLFEDNQSRLSKAYDYLNKGN